MVKRNARPEAGDLILVVPHVSGKAFLAIQSITSLLLPATVAVAAIAK